MNDYLISCLLIKQAGWKSTGHIQMIKLNYDRTRSRGCPVLDA